MCTISGYDPIGSTDQRTNSHFHRTGSPAAAGGPAAVGAIGNGRTP
ncbi:MAG TPA: hypothetical protein VJ757_14150 [Pseudonocardiaceae bacterium]|nr:hypothetical protein [Pseudonocardiaceae bacterium]